MVVAVAARATVGAVPVGVHALLAFVDFGELERFAFHGRYGNCVHFRAAEPAIVSASCSDFFGAREIYAVWASR